MRIPGMAEELTFKDEAAREGAYRFLGNEAVDCEAVRSVGARAARL